MQYRLEFDMNDKGYCNIYQILFCVTYPKFDIDM